MKKDHKFYPLVAAPALGTAFLLMIPLVAMQFTQEVVWTRSDFLIAGILIFSTGLSYKLITKQSTKTMYRIAVGSALASGFVLVWVNLAVGLIGPANNPANLMYFAVIAVGIIGALIARFRPHGMSLTMLAMALAMLSIIIIVLLTSQHHLPSISITEILSVNSFFIILFGFSALLFRYADTQKKIRT